jgi:glutathione S-transferase
MDRKLHVFGPAFGLPDPSPFCMKGIILLRMAGLPFETIRGDVTKAPKKKFPVLVEDGVPIPDTTLMRFHIERKHGFDFDTGLTAPERAQAWAFEKLCEDNLYWAIVKERWVDRANFDRGPRSFFDTVPAPLRPIIVSVVRREVKRNLYGQGLGRHTDSERTDIAKRGIDALADQLAGKPWLMGDRPCGADAIVSATIAGTLCPVFESAIGDHARTHANLVAYADRAISTWFPDFDASA